MDTVDDMTNSTAADIDCGCGVYNPEIGECDCNAGGKQGPYSCIRDTVDDPDSDGVVWNGNCVWRAIRGSRS